MKKIPFDERENIVTGQSEFRGIITRFYNNRPISEKENTRMLYTEDHPMWIPAGRAGSLNFCPQVIPDNIARAFVFDGSGFDNSKGGGVDMFGIPWVYVPVAGGSMEDPAFPHPLEDANDWEDVIKFPDIDSWDWAGAREANKDYLNTDKWVVSSLLNGAWYERLISFLGFENAAMALIDEDQQDAVKALFARTTKLYMDIVDKYAEYFPEVDALNVHDDWGSQKSPFFSQATAMEMIAPYMRQLTDHIRARGFVADMHSCGHTDSRIEAYIAGGWDSWTPQPMNDTEKLFREYGDRIIMTVILDLPPDLPEEEQRAEAKKFVETHCFTGKKLKVIADSHLVAFEQEVYKQSRLAYLSL